MICIRVRDSCRIFVSGAQMRAVAGRRAGHENDDPRRAGVRDAAGWRGILGWPTWVRAAIPSAGERTHFMLNLVHWIWHRGLRSARCLIL